MATAGHSASFEYGDGTDATSSSNYTKVAGVTDIGAISIDADDIDTSTMDSPEQFKEFDPGWADAGEFEITLQFERTQASTLYGLFRASRGFRVTYSDGSIWELSGYIKGFGTEVEREELVTNTATMKISGKPTFTPAA